MEWRDCHSFIGCHNISTSFLRSCIKTGLFLTFFGLLCSCPVAGSMSTFDLGGISKSHVGEIKPNSVANTSGKRVVSTATNSPIYYINKLDLTSLLLNFLPLDAKKTAKQPPRLPPGLFSSFFAPPDVQRSNASNFSPPDLLSFLKWKTTTATGTVATPTTKPPVVQHPFKRIPLPFISNARPIGSYKLKPAAAAISSQGRPTLDMVDASSRPLPILETLISTGTTTTVIPMPLPEVHRPYVPPTKSTVVSHYVPSKIIRLNTKFVANGQPSSVYVFKSPIRRYSLQDLLRRPVRPTHDNTLRNRNHIKNSAKRKETLGLALL